MAQLKDLLVNGVSHFIGNIYGTLKGNADTATKLASPQTVYVALNNNSTTTTIEGGSSSAETIGVNGVLSPGNGGTGKSAWDINKITYSPTADTLGQLSHASSTSFLLKSGSASASPSWIEYTSSNTDSTIVQRDSSGNFSAGTITAALSGNATTATGANLTTTQNALAYYSDTSGTFANSAIIISSKRIGGWINGGQKPGTTLGARATAEGYSTTASGDDSHAEGYGTTASGDDSHAEGWNTIAQGNESHAEGWSTITYGTCSHAEGHGTTAQRKSQHVFGEYNILDTTGVNGTVRGSYVEIVGNGTASNARANARTLDWDGNESLAGNLLPMITNTKDLGSSSLKWANVYATNFNGNATTATKANLITAANTMAYYTDATGTFGYSTGNYINNNKLAINDTNEPTENLYVSGSTKINGSFNQGNENTASGEGAHAEGYYTTATGNYSHAEGHKTTASINYAHSEGYLTIASANYAHAEGAFTIASARSAHAEGNSFQPYGIIFITSLSTTDDHLNYSCIFDGVNLTQTDYNRFITNGQLYALSPDSNRGMIKIDQVDLTNNSIRFTKTFASNTLSSQGVSLFIYNVASSAYSHAEGRGTAATAIGAHAEGLYTEAKGTYSHTEGEGTCANRAKQHVFGKYNILDTSGANNTVEGTYVEIVGNGLVDETTREITRTNARTLDWDGNESLAGNLLPMVTDTKDLGSSSLKWANVYATNLIGEFVGQDSDAQGSTFTITTAPSQVCGIIYLGGISSSTTNLFPTSNNSNSILTLNRHEKNSSNYTYDSQIGFSSNGNIYYRYTNGSTTLAAGVGSWKKIAFIDDAYKVTQQSATTQTGFYPVLFSAKSNTEEGGGTADRTGTVLFNTSVKVKPSTGVLYGAAQNDYAEYRHTKAIIEPGYCVREVGDDTLELTTQRLERGCEIVSDTFGFIIGQTDECQTPIAASGRVLAYPYESREEFAKHIGYPVCSGPNGTVSIMTEEEEEKYPSRIIGTISAVPDYETWGAGNVEVNGRVWIRIR